jgi:hypothetical protein
MKPQLISTALCLIVHCACRAGETAGTLQNPLAVRWTSLDQATRSTVFQDLKPRLVRLEGVDGIIQWRVPGTQESSLRVRPDRMARVGGFLGGERGYSVTLGYVENRSRLEEIGCQYIQTRVSQSLGADNYLIAQNSTMIVVPGNETLVDGASLSGFAKADGTFEYTTVQAAPRRIPRLLMLSSAEVNAEAFLDALRNGQRFLFIRDMTDTCPECKGYRTFKSKSGKIGGDPCPKCNGTGKLSVKRCCVLAW